MKTKFMDWYCRSFHNVSRVWHGSYQICLTCSRRLTPLVDFSKEGDAHSHYVQPRVQQSAASSEAVA